MNAARGYHEKTIYIGKMPRRSNLWMADFLLHMAAKEWVLERALTQNTTAAL